MALTDLHTTGEFENLMGETCILTLELDATETQHEYNVRTYKRYLQRRGGTVTVHTENSVETFYSMKTARRAYNWELYQLGAQTHQTIMFTLHESPVVPPSAELEWHSLNKR